MVKIVCFSSINFNKIIWTTLVNISTKSNKYRSWENASVYNGPNHLEFFYLLCYCAFDPANVYMLTNTCYQLTMLVNNLVGYNFIHW